MSTHVASDVAAIAAMSPEEVARALREECRAAEAAALRILGGAAQSEAALHRRLLRRGFSDEAASAATTAAVESGYVDDGALAASIVSRRRGRRGAARITAELRARGIAPDVARTATAGIPFEEQRAAALSEARRRLHGHTLPDAWPDRRRHLSRIAAALSRLGFPADAITHALATLAAESPDAP
jgi:SOS response regulatory protein OraA/RecX